MTPHGLNDRTRTYDLYHPKVAFYQTELYLDNVVGRVGLEPTQPIGGGFMVLNPRIELGIEMFENLDHSQFVLDAE